MTVVVREQVWEKTNGHCWYCGKQMDPYGDFTVDHVKPLRHGGKSHYANLVPACKSCNSSKHHLPLETWRVAIMQRKYGLFTDKHIAYLESLGFILPEGFPCYPRHLFWFEQQNISSAT